MAIGPFEAASIVVAVAAAAAYLNHRTFRLPQTIALTLVGAVASAVVALVDVVWPGAGLAQAARAFLASIDFEATLLNAMLSFLLFAGALHIDIGQTRVSTMTLVLPIPRD